MYTKPCSIKSADNFEKRRRRTCEAYIYVLGFLPRSQPRHFQRIYMSPPWVSHTGCMDTLRRSKTVCSKTRVNGAVGMKHNTYFVNGLKRGYKSPLTQPWLVKICTPQQVRVTEHELYRPFSGFVIIFATDQTPRLDHIAHDLDVESPISWIVEDKNSRERCLTKVGTLFYVWFLVCRDTKNAHLDGRSLVRSNLVKWPNTANRSRPRMSSSLCQDLRRIPREDVKSSVGLIKAIPNPSSSVLSPWFHKNKTV
jgi:hypothetical protein